MSTRRDALRVAAAALDLAARAEPRAAVRVREVADALRVALAEETAARGDGDPDEFVSPGFAAQALGIAEDSVHAHCRRKGALACVRDGRNWRVRASWVAEQRLRASRLSRRP